MDGSSIDDSAGQPTGDRDLQPAPAATEPEYPEPRSEQTDQPGTERSHEQSAERETAGVADERSHELENMGEREHERRPGTADLEQQVAEIEVDDPNHASERRDHAEAARFGAPDERARRAAGDAPDEREWTEDTFTAGISRPQPTQPEQLARQGRGDDAQRPAPTGWPDQPDRHRPESSDEDRSHTDRQPEQLAEPAEKPERDTAGVSEVRLPGEPQRQATDGPVHEGRELRHPQELQRTPSEEHPAGQGSDKAPEPVRREPPHQPDVVVAPAPGEPEAKPEREPFNIDQELARAEAARAILAERRAEREAEIRATADRSSYHAVEQQRQIDRGIDR